MYEKINYTLVGFFVIIFTALILFFAFWLAKDSVSKNIYNIYYCNFIESVDGLNVDSVVKLNGVDVGRLKKLEINPQNPILIKATLFINKKIKITKDMYAVLKSQGLTGLRYINITGGKSKEIIKPNTNNSIIKTKVSLISQISNTAPVIIKKIEDLSDKLNKTLSEQNIKNIEAILNNSKKITEETVKLEENLNTIVSDINKTQINAVLQMVQELNNRLNSTLSEYKKLAKNGNITLTTINRHLPTLIQNFNKSSIELQKVSKLIRVGINRGDYNLRKILKPAIADINELTIDFKEVLDELKSLLQNPTDKIFNSASVPKGPGE